MNVIIGVHVAAGIAAIMLGTVAVTVQKGRAAHASAGTWFVLAMLVLGISGIVSAALSPSMDVALTASGAITIYFVATSWLSARRRDGRPGIAEKSACAIIWAMAALFGASAVAAAISPESTFFGAGAPLHGGLAALCAFAGALDLKFILGTKLSGKQRISRHLWRMCFAFLLATSFAFLGQQDKMPQAMRGSPILYLAALGPLFVMAFWLIGLRFGKAFGILTLLKRFSPAPGSAAAPARPELDN